MRLLGDRRILAAEIEGGKLGFEASLAAACLAGGVLDGVLEVSGGGGRPNESGLGGVLADVGVLEAGDGGCRLRLTEESLNGLCFGEPVSLLEVKEELSIVSGEGAVPDGTGQGIDVIVVLILEILSGEFVIDLLLGIFVGFDGGSGIGGEEIEGETEDGEGLDDVVLSGGVGAGLVELLDRDLAGSGESSAEPFAGGCHDWISFWWISVCSSFATFPSYPESTEKDMN